MRNAQRYSLVRPLVVAVTLMLPGAAVLAAPMDVHTRSLDANAYNLGRAGGSAYTDSRDAAIASEHSQAGEAAWNKTKAGAEHAWDKTKAVAATPPTLPPDEPQRYGRAGGFIGSEQFEVPQPGVTELGSAPANADAVKSGESQWGYADRSAAATSANRQGTADMHRPDANSEAARGQPEQPVQR
jgi:hypothetical protein